MPLLLLLACHTPKPGDSAAPALTLEEAVAAASEGDALTVRGFVHTLTFDSTLVTDTDTEEEEDGGDRWQRIDGSWLLLRSEIPDGVAWADVTGDTVTDDDVVALGWGLGIPLAAGDARPRIGDEVEVSGTLARPSWNGHPVPILEAPTVTIVSGTPPAQAGDACASDDDCADQLVCDRATTTCAAPAEVGWGSTWRDVDGHCTSDADCPLGQVCDTDYVVPDSGDYTWRYDGAAKSGASLCVPAVDDPDVACPAVWSPRDLAGGRFTEGREVCVEGDVQLTVAAEDGDTHLQLNVDEPIPYPMMDAHVWFFGATTEIGPPHKSPDRPEGAVEDPAIGSHIRVLGTIRWDGGHGWYEVHPVKQWWEVPAP